MCAEQLWSRNRACLEWILASGGLMLRPSSGESTDTAGRTTCRIMPVALSTIAV